MTLKGTVNFSNGAVLRKGGIVPSTYAIQVNRTGDFSVGIIDFAVRLDQLSTLHDLHTDLEENNTSGSIEATLANLDLFFQVPTLIDE